MTQDLHAQAMAYLAISIATWTAAQITHGVGMYFNYVLSGMFLLMFLITEWDLRQERRRRRRRPKITNHD